MDIEQITEYALQIPERKRTLETLESLIERRLSKLVLDPADALDIDDPITDKIASYTVERAKIEFSMPLPVDNNEIAGTSTLALVKKKSKKIAFPAINHPKKETISTSTDENKLLGGKLMHTPTSEVEETEKKKSKSVFDSISEILNAKESSPRKDIVKNLIQIIKTGRSAKSKDELVNGFEQETWSRLSGEERKAKRLKTKNLHSKDLHSKGRKKKYTGKDKKIADDSHSDEVVISRLLVCLSHNHPSEAKKMFVDIDKKSRQRRVRLDMLEFSRILSKPSSSRTNSEIQGVDDYLRLLPEFQAKPDYIINHLCQTLYISLFNLGEPIFRQGDSGTKWFVILTGTVKITVAKPGWSFLDPKSPQNYIATLKAGENFGDHALLNDLNRSASAWADSEPTILLTLDKQDFLRLIGQAHQIEQKNRLMLLKKIPMLGRLDLPSLKNIADRLVIRTIPPSTILQNEGEMTETVFFIKSGTCAVFRNVFIGSEKIKKTLLLGHLCAFTSFNEGCAFSSRATTRKGAPYTVVTIDTVVIATIACNGEWLNFNLSKFPSFFEDLSNEDLAHRYKLSLQAQTFRKYQKKYVTALSLGKKNRNK